MLNIRIGDEDERETLWFRFARRRIAEAIEQGDWLEARKVAYQWADGTCARLGVTRTGVWKLFKRSLVERWFGPIENRRFEPGWSVQEALEYANSCSGRSVRFSLFPEDIACHATSCCLPLGKEEHWERIIAQVDNSVAMEMFPESSTDDTICFRRYATEYGEEVVYEAGKGQAMFVFEQEQGRHPIVAATKVGHQYVYSSRVPPNGTVESADEIETKLRALIDLRDNDLARKCQSICRALGTDHVSIEGYFDPARSENLSMVDLDLPFDYAFMDPKPR